MPRFSLHPQEPGYPLRLAALADRPGRLHVDGALLETTKVCAVVGARAASGHGVALARRIAADLVRDGVAVISGGAVGIDSAAHRGALDAGGHTIAVLAGGLDVAATGRARPLLDEIARRGALLSAYDDGTPALRHHFLARNRLIAAMSDAVLVVEAQLGSGSLYTARAARALGRAVVAVAGSPGCEALLASGAALADGAGDVLLALDGRPRRPQVVLPEQGSREAVVFEALGADRPRDATALADLTGLPAREVVRALGGLELGGLAVSLAGQTYVRSFLAQELLARG